MWRPGIEHKVVDCFSRHPVEVPGETWREKLKWNTCTFRTLRIRMVRAPDCDTGEHIIEDQRLKSLKFERNVPRMTTTTIWYRLQPRGFLSSLIFYLPEYDRTGVFVMSWPWMMVSFCGEQGWSFRNHCGKRFFSNYMRPIRARRHRYKERDRLFIGQTFPMTSETLFVPVQLVLSTSHLSHKSLCSRMNGPLDRLKVLLVIFVM